MPPKENVEKKKDDESDYTYCTEEEDEEQEPEPSPSVKATAAASDEKAAIAAVRNYESRKAEDRESSSDRGPRARAHRSPVPAGENISEKPKSPDGRPARTSRGADQSLSTGKPTSGRGDPFPPLPDGPLVPPPPPPRGKWTKSSKQWCIHCWQKVGRSPAGSTAGMSQHMYWNELCLTWQIFGDGSRCSWEDAMRRAHGLKLHRETEALAEMGADVVLARSRDQRRLKEERGGSECDRGVPREPETGRGRLRGASGEGLRDLVDKHATSRRHAGEVPREHGYKREESKRRHAEEVPCEHGEPEDKAGRRRKHKKQRRPRRSPSPDVRAGPKGPRHPPSSDDEDDRDVGASRRRAAPDEVWIKVPRAAVMGH